MNISFASYPMMLPANASKQSPASAPPEDFSMTPHMMIVKNPDGSLVAGISEIPDGYFAKATTEVPLCVKRFRRGEAMSHQTYKDLFAASRDVAEDKDGSVTTGDASTMSLADQSNKIAVYRERMASAMAIDEEALWRVL